MMSPAVRITFGGRSAWALRADLGREKAETRKVFPDKGLAKSGFSGSAFFLSCVLIGAYVKTGGTPSAVGARSGEGRRFCGGKGLKFQELGRILSADPPRLRGD